jgi:PAS domain-containing protein
MPADDWAGLFASAFQGTRNAMLLTDARRVVVDATAAYMTLIGRPRDAFVGRPVWELVIDGPLLTEPAWQAAVASGRFDGEVELHGAAGAVPHGVCHQFGHDHLDPPTVVLGEDVSSGLAHEFARTRGCVRACGQLEGN